MRRITTQFGEVAVDPAGLFRFSRPLLGFEDARNYVVLEPAEFRPFFWLQSVDRPEVSFPLADPWLFFPDYSPALPPDFLSELGLEGGGEVAVYCLVSRGPGGLGMNLAAPVVFCIARKRGGQAVLDGSYPTHQPLPRWREAPCW